MLEQNCVGKHKLPRVDFTIECPKTAQQMGSGLPQLAKYSQWIPPLSQVQLLSKITSLANKVNCLAKLPQKYTSLRRARRMSLSTLYLEEFNTEVLDESMGIPSRVFGPTRVAIIPTWREAWMRGTN